MITLSIVYAVGVLLMSTAAHEAKMNRARSGAIALAWPLFVVVWIPLGIVTLVGLAGEAVSRLTTKKAPKP